MTPRYISKQYKSVDRRGQMIAVDSPVWYYFDENKQELGYSTELGGHAHITPMNREWAPEVLARHILIEFTSPNFKQAPHLFDEMVSVLNTEAWNKFKGGK